MRLWSQRTCHRCQNNLRLKKPFIRHLSCYSCPAQRVYSSIILISGINSINRLWEVLSAVFTCVSATSYSTYVSCRIVYRVSKSRVSYWIAHVAHVAEGAKRNMVTHLLFRRWVQSWTGLQSVVVIRVSTLRGVCTVQYSMIVLLVCWKRRPLGGGNECREVSTPTIRV